MNTNLFFEGPVRSGKSTVLRQTLRPYLPDLGGFVVQRLLDEAGHPAAYRLQGLPGLIDSTTLEEAEAQFLAVDGSFTGRESDVFLQIPSRRFDPTVFETKALSILKDSLNKKIVLLDEIGGVELTIPSFRKALIRLLQGPIPCLGIIKETNKAREALQFNQDIRLIMLVNTINSETLAEIPFQMNRFLQQFYPHKKT